VDLELFEGDWEDKVRLSGDEFLVSSRYVALHAQSGFSGMEPFAPVDIKRIKYYQRHNRPPPPQYFRAKILRNAARIDDVASGIVRESRNPLCPRCGGGTIVRFERLVVIPESWTGEDWFEPQNIGGRWLVTDRVVTAVREAGLRGFHFSRCDRTKYRLHPQMDIHGNMLDD
jgi:hypothetical protein